MSSRRSSVDFDPDHFANLDPDGRLSMAEVFELAHRQEIEA